MKDGKQEVLTHGERLTATIGLHPNRRCLTTRDRRRTLRVSVAVLTAMASMAAVCLMDSAALRLQHHKLQGYARVDARSVSGRRAPDRGASGEDDFAHE